MVKELPQKATWLDKVIAQYRPRSGVAKIFGVILYSDANPFVKKALNDEDIWKALDEISGDMWAIFAIRSTRGGYGFPSFSPEPGTFYQMVPVWQEPKENMELVRDFGLASSQEFPLLIIFSYTNEGRMVVYKHKFKDESFEMVFKELRRVMASVAKALKCVSKENIDNGEGVFSAVTYALQSEKHWEMVKAGMTYMARIIPKLKAVF